MREPVNVKLVTDHQAVFASQATEKWCAVAGTQMVLAILGLGEAFKKDSNPRKINLSVGVYKDEKGNTPEAYRRGPHRWVAGICGGLSAKFGWDPTLVRIVVLLSFLLPFIGVGTYLLAWLLLPWQDGSIPLERALPDPHSR